MSASGMPAAATYLGLLLLALVLMASLLPRLPISSAMLYMSVGMVLGPWGLELVAFDLRQHARVLEFASELALLISLFAVGLQLGIPWRDERWRLPLKLALISMGCMVATVALIGVWLLGLPLGAGVLLGAILAPTDPVLATGLQSDAAARPDRLRFSLAGEGALNDASAFPFVMLGLGLLGFHELGPDCGRWLLADLLWPTAAGALTGIALGAGAGRLIVYLRTRHHQAVGLDMFLGLGLIALSTGVAQLMEASGFLAVLGTGLAFQRVAESPLPDSGPIQASKQRPHAYEHRATHSHHASATMRESVQLFNGQLEKLAELILVLIVGTLLASTSWRPSLFWFLPLLFLVLRPLSVLVVLPGSALSPAQAVLSAWFGIRGVGSIYYLCFSINRGLDPLTSELLGSLTLWTVATSILLHGLTAQPLMHLYARRPP